MDDDDETEEHATIGEPAVRRRSSILPGDRYALAGEIAHGGMGEVLAARDSQIGRDVAIKRLRSDSPSDRAVTRFLREARIQGRLDHPAIVPVYEIGRDRDGLPFFAMKRLTGTTLAKLVTSSEANVLPLLRAFVDVCLAVEFAHVRGIIHRDLKPQNIVLGDFGDVYVIDWGVAKVLGDVDDFTDIGSGSGGSGDDATREGTAIGTPGYMAPEQLRGFTDVDVRVDVYALGCCLFEILCGEELHPRGAAATKSTLGGADARPSQRAPERGIPPELDAVCVAATALDREHRIASARELGDRVQRFLDGDRDLKLRTQLAAEHFAHARAAFDHPADGARNTAIR